jgi:hypothetical protein
MRTFKPTAEMITAAETVFVAMAAVHVIEPIVTKYQTEILVAGQWKPDPKWTDRPRGLKSEVILDPNRAYLLAEPAFKEFLAKCKQGREAAGLHVDNDDFCPLLVAQHDVVKAKRALIESMQSVTGIGADVICRAHDQDYKKYVELSLKLMAPYVRPVSKLIPQPHQ